MVALDASFYTSLATRILIFALAALSLDLILGYGGLVSFGHAAFMGIGGYTVGILFHHSAMMTPIFGLPGTRPRSWSGRSAFFFRACSRC